MRWTIGWACLFLAGTTQAAILNDTFADGGITNGADVLDTNWFLITGSGALTAQSDTTTGPNEGVADTALQHAAATFSGVGGSFTPTTIAVGETMRLSFDVRFTGTPSNNGAGFRFGLYNSNGGTIGTGSSGNDFGYVIRSGSGTSSGGSVAKEVGGSTGPFGGLDILTLGRYTPAPPLGTTSKNYVMELTRLSATEIGIGFKIDGVTYSDSVTEGFTTDNGSRTRLPSVPMGDEPASGGAAYFTFDEVLIGTGNNATTYRVDNVKLEVVPEPASLAAIGLLGLALGRRRRHG